MNNDTMFKVFRIRLLIELMRMENNLAERETQHSDGWLYDHAQAIRQHAAEIDSLLAHNTEVQP